MLKQNKGGGGLQASCLDLPLYLVLGNGSVKEFDECEYVYFSENWIPFSYITVSLDFIFHGYPSDPYLTKNLHLDVFSLVP